MANKIFPDFPELPDVAGEQILLVDTGIQTFKATVEQVEDYILRDGNVPAAALTPTIVDDLDAATPAEDDFLAAADTDDGGELKKVEVGGLKKFPTTLTADATLAPNRSYVVNKSGSIAILTLPATANIGDRIEIQGLSSNGWAIYNNSSTSTTMNDNSVPVSRASGGTGPLIKSNAAFSSIGIVCVGSAGSAWAVFSKNGTAVTLNYFGSEADGDVTISSNTSLTPPGITGSYDAEMIVKNYKNLTINSSCTLTASQPCRGMLLYVAGNLTVNGTISMSNRGSFTNATSVGVGSGGLNIRRFKSGNSPVGTSSDLSGCGTAAIAAEANQPSLPGPDIVVNVPRAGGAGGVDTGSQQAGQTATNAMGGGGTGGRFTASAGNGTAGTCFAGGTGGGGAGISGDGGFNGTANGGAGGLGGGSGGGQGAGNPPAAGSGGTGGLGGLLIIIVKGNVTVGASGSIQANGGQGGSNAYAGGGGGGGGRVILLHGGTLTNNGTISANGGAGGTGGGGGNNGSPGGAGVVTTSQIDA